MFTRPTVVQAGNNYDFEATSESSRSSLSSEPSEFSFTLTLPSLSSDVDGDQPAEEDLHHGSQIPVFFVPPQRRCYIMVDGIVHGYFDNGVYHTADV